MPPSLPLSIIADITVVTSSPQVAAPLFNTMLFIGNTVAIPSYGVNSRVRTYLLATYSTAMISDGFTTSSPEYIAVQMYFSQTVPPQQVQVGRQDTTSILTWTVTSGNLGTGYAVGDQVTVTQGGASHGVFRVATIGSNGTVTSLTQLSGGTGYAIASALATTTSGSGTGVEVDVTAIGETAVQAAQACRTASGIWYPFMFVIAQPADHIALATWTQGQTGTIYLGTDSETAVLNGIANNTFKQIFAVNSSRTYMQYATTQSGVFPNQIYFTAAVGGQMMSSNTQLANSSFTEKFSGGVPLVGVVVEPLNDINFIHNIEGQSTITGPNGNLYLNYGGSYNVEEQGTMMAPNVFFDQIIGLDILAANMQFAIMNLLTSVPKIPQTDAGQQLLIQAVETALAQSAITGFLAAGVWQGQTILNLTPGQALPLGYLVQSPKYSTLTQAQIQARIAPPIYVALIEAGAVHFVTVQVLVQV